MNRLISMAEAAKMLRIQGTDAVRRARRRLLQIADGNPRFRIFRLGPNGREFFTTRDDLRRILPQLFPGPDQEAELEDELEELRADHVALKKRVVALENNQFVQIHGAHRP